MYWVSGSIYIHELDTDIEKESNVMLKLFYDKRSRAGGVDLGFYLLYAPSVTIKEYDGGGDLVEFGLSFKTDFDLQDGMLARPGLNLGYRTLNSSQIETIRGLGVNLSVQVMKPKVSSTPFFEVGFLSQPSGGNTDSDVTFAPILYIGGGIIR